MNKPVAWMLTLPDGTHDWILDGRNCEGYIPLYTHQYERPHNTVLVPCDKLAEMQNEIKTLKAELSKYKQPYQYKKGMENLA